MQDARDARARALDGLVGRGVLNRSQADAVHAALDAAGISGTAAPGAGQAAAPGQPGAAGSSAAGPAGSGGATGGSRDSGGVRWAEVVGYIGGGLVLAAVGTFMATAWDALDTPVRIGLLAAVAVVLAAAGLGMAGGPAALRRSADVPTGRRRIGGALFALAALSLAFAAGETADAALPGSAVPSPPIIGAAVGLAAALAGYLPLRSAPGLVATWGMSVFLAGFGVQEAVQELMQTTSWQTAENVSGAVLLLTGAVWAGLAAAGAVREQGTAVGLGAATAYSGALMLQTPVNHAAELVVAAALFTLAAVSALWRRDGRGQGAALIFGVLAATVAVPRLVWELTDGEVSAAGVLLVAGAVLLAASAAGIRLHRRQAAPEPHAPDDNDTSPPPEQPNGPAPDAAAPPRVDPRDPDQRL